MKTKCLLYCTKEADLVYFAYGDETYQAFKTGEDWVNSHYNPNDIALYNGKASIVYEYGNYCSKDEMDYVWLNGKLEGFA